MIDPGAMRHKALSIPVFTRMELARMTVTMASGEKSRTGDLRDKLVRNDGEFVDECFVRSSDWMQIYDRQLHRTGKDSPFSFDEEESRPNEATTS